jgi:hypothetical protein
VTRRLGKIGGFNSCFGRGEGAGVEQIPTTAKNVAFFTFSCFMVLNNSNNNSKKASECRVGIETGAMAEAGALTTELRRILVI